MLVMTGCLVAGSLTALTLAGAQVRRTEWNEWLTGQATGFNGVALIGLDDVIETEMAFGPADPASGRLNVRDTRFNLGSINKTFTAVGIAQLIEEGRLGLHDALVKHLPDYPDKAAAGRITIRQLLTHRSGVAQFMRADFGDVDVAAMTKIVGNEPLAFEPGTRQIYSNGGYVVLGRVIEVVSGKSYAQYVNERIYTRAGMTASGSFAAVIARTTSPYRWSRRRQTVREGREWPRRRRVLAQGILPAAVTRPPPISSGSRVRCVPVVCSVRR
jgi:CubicO group peptidase (beta-lactamase class C family)